MSKYVTRKWIEVNDLSGGQHFVNKKVKFKIPMLRSNLYDYSYAYIIVKGTIAVEGTNDDNEGNKNLVFKNNGQFRSCILKIVRKWRRCSYSYTNV